MSQTLFIRADASAQIGTGHVMRCLALAETWQRAGGSVIFSSADLPAASQQKLAQMQIPLIQVSQTPGSHEDCKFLAENAKGRASWVVIDGYHFDDKFQRQIKDAGLRLLVIDDFAHAQNYFADLVLDQNLGAKNSLYKNRAEQTRLLLGPRYVLLRHEFLKWQNRIQNISGVARKILVTLGGGDPDNVTSLVLRGLQEMKIADLDVTVVVGSSNPHDEEIKTLAASCLFKVRLRKGVSNMAELMSEADFAIAAGGTTSWELAFMGVPCATLVLAENQREVAQQLELAGISISLGWHTQVSAAEIAQKIIPRLTDEAARAEMSRRGRLLIDGEGRDRMVMILREQPLRLRRVQRADCRKFWEWANEPEVRAVAFESGTIPWERHVEWFKHKIEDPNCHIYVALNDQEQLIGQGRFEMTDGSRAEMDVSVDKSHRGLGLGHVLIQMAVQELFRQTKIQTVDAFIKPDNQASLGAFEKACFRRVGLETIKGCAALHLIYERTSTS